MSASSKILILVLLMICSSFAQPLTTVDRAKLVAKNNPTTKFLCYEFVWRTISKDLAILDDMAIRLNTSNLVKIEEQVRKGNPKTKGVQEALVKRGRGIIIHENDVQAGDMVQYWYKDTETFFGHCAIVESVDREYIYLISSTIYAGVTGRYLDNLQSYDIIKRGDRHVRAYYVRLK